MTDINKISDLCYTVSFAFDRLADISIQVHDLEKESIKTPISVENVEQNVIKFNTELDDVPKMRPSNRTYVPRRSTFAPRQNYPISNSYRIVPNSGPMPRVFNPRNDQVNSSSLLYRKRPTSESIEGLNETKQVKGIKWVAATTEEVQNSWLNIENLAKDTNPRFRIKIEPPYNDNSTFLREEDAAINSILRSLNECNESESSGVDY